MGDKEEAALPKSTITKLIKEALPDEVKCGTDARDLIADCCMEFLQLLASEANEVCTKENKKTISAEHILKAVETLGFSDYLEDMKDSLTKIKAEVAAQPKATKKLEDSGLSQEALLAQQQELFARAKNALQSSQGGLTASSDQVHLVHNPVATAAAPASGVDIDADMDDA